MRWHCCTYFVVFLMCVYRYCSLKFLPFSPRLQSFLQVSVPFLSVSISLSHIGATKLTHTFPLPSASRHHLLLFSFPPLFTSPSNVAKKNWLRHVALVVLLYFYFHFCTHPPEANFTLFGCRCKALRNNEHSLFLRRLAITWRRGVSIRRRGVSIRTV